MIVEQLYTGCLSEAAYYLESNGEAAIIDPLRDPKPYLDLAKKNGVKIKYIFETHFHADFVSGHAELAELTGATIIYGPNANTHFKCHNAVDGEVFSLGAITITALHTPGHTLESSTYLLKDEQGQDHCIFTGDTLFIGDVGRPDLAIASDLTVSDLAGMMYDSLRNKILPLADSVIVYPAHGAGSSCGKNLSKETYDTLGHQRKSNYALQAMSKAEFIQAITDGLAAAPAYFPQAAMMNKLGAKALHNVKNDGLKSLSLKDFDAIVQDKNVVILDTRSPQIFAAAHYPNAINIGLDGQFAPWVGALIQDVTKPIIVIAEIGREEEVVTRLARVGFDNILGFLAEPINASSSILSISAEHWATQWTREMNILDVRKPGEYSAGHIAGVKNYPLDEIYQWLPSLDKVKPYYIHCAGGYRSMAAASILKAQGFESVVDIAGGYGAISKTAIPLESAVASA